MNISQIDLNLLLVLHTVLEAGSAAAAARRLHVTPSAISNSLARLRVLLGDPLVVRSGRGLVATPRARELAPHLRAAIAELGRVLGGPERFDPATTTRAFALALSDAHQICDLPRIAGAFASQLPRANLRIASVDHLEAAGGLGSGDIDAALAPAHPLPPGHHAVDLYQEEGALVVRRGHPAARRPLTPEVWAGLRHIDIHLALGRGGIGNQAADAWLAKRGLRRDIAVTVPSFFAAATVAAHTDYITGMPRRLAEALALATPLAVLTLPGPPMYFPIQLVWHDRTDRDPGARVFRELVIAALATTRPKRHSRAGKPKPAA